MTVSGEPSDAGGQPSHRRFWWIITALVVAEATCALESNMIFVALATLYRIYGDPARVGWMVTAFGLTSAATAAVSSRLGDIFGRRKVMLIMLALGLVGSLVSAFASDLNVIIAGRALQGASMAVLPLAFGILREHAPPGQLNVGVGMLGGVYAIAAASGAVLGGWIIDRGDWRNIFLVSATVAAVALALILLLVPPSPGKRPDGPLDLAGGVLFVAPIALLLLAITNGRAWGWTSPAFLGLLAAGGVGLGCWLRHELRTANPLIDVRLMTHPQIAMANLTIFLAMLGPSVYPQVVLPMIQQPVWTGVGLGVTALVAGVVKLPSNLTAGVAAISAGFLARAVGMRAIVIASAVTVTGGLLLLIASHGSLWVITAIMVLLLAPFLNVIFACTPALIIEAAPPDRTSEATGITQVLRAMGLSIGGQLAAVVLATSSVSNSAGARFPDGRAYVTTLGLMAAVSVLMVVAAFLIPRRPPSAA